jgi:hypothetical protein
MRAIGTRSYDETFVPDRFDGVLSHISSDKPTVRALGQLVSRRLRVQVAEREAYLAVGGG